MKRLLILFWLSAIAPLAATAAEKPVEIARDFGTLCGTLLTPESGCETVALIIAGSGPTDRNGNGMAGTNNSLRYLAEALEKAGIASLRYDKRGIGSSRYDRAEEFREEALSFDNFVDDASACVDYLAAEGYRRIVLIGHSEGSLIAMCAARQNPKITALTLVAGAGFPMGDILKLQLAQQLALVDPALMIQANGVIDRLARGEKVENPPQQLAALFRQSVQPYLISQMRLDPRKIIATLSVPILIVQGDNDLQVTVDNAQALHRAQSKAELKIVEEMTHVLKKSTAHDQPTQYASVYTNPDLPIAPELTQAIEQFIAKL